MFIEALLLDFDDTLVVEEASAEEAFLEACELAREKHGIDPVALHESLRRCARNIWKASPTHPYCRTVGIASWEGLWARFTGDDPNVGALREWQPEYKRRSWCDALAEHDVDDALLAELLAQTFEERRRRKHIVFPEAEAVLKQLRGKFKLGLITNGAADLQREKIDGSGLGHYFDSITISGEVGVGKPDPAIFKAALDSLGITAEAAVMIGNSLKRDIAGAQAAGMRAIWINRTGTPCHDDVRTDAEIANLSELSAMIEELQEG